MRRVRRLGESHEPRRARLRPHRRRVGGDGRELRAPPAWRARIEPSTRRLDLIRQAAFEVGRPDRVRRRDHRRRLHPDLHARGARRPDVPPDGVHRVRRRARLTRARAHLCAGGRRVSSSRARPARSDAPRRTKTRVVRRAARAVRASARVGARAPRRGRSAARSALLVDGARFRPIPRHGVHAEARRRLPAHRDATGAERVAAQGMAVSTDVERTLRRFPEVASVVTNLGRPQEATETMALNQADVYVTFKPKSEWRDGRSTSSLPRMDSALAEIPGLDYEFSAPMRCGSTRSSRASRLISASRSTATACRCSRRRPRRSRASSRRCPARKTSRLA